jgi:hypothetical protein
MYHPFLRWSSNGSATDRSRREGGGGLVVFFWGAQKNKKQKSPDFPLKMPRNPGKVQNWTANFRRKLQKSDFFVRNTA